MNQQASNVRNAERVRQGIIALCHAGLSSRELRVNLIQRLHKAIPIDVSFFTTVDPATLLFTGAVADEILARATPQFISNEFFQDDVNKFAWLAHRPKTVASLLQSTQNDLAQSARYRDILVPLALGDELRAALITDETCWGFICLHRNRAGRPFTEAEAAFLDRVTPYIAEGLRNSLLISSVRRSSTADEPGLLLLADDLSIIAITPVAEHWLAEVTETDSPKGLGLPGKLPYAVVAVVARLLAMEQATGEQEATQELQQEKDLPGIEGPQERMPKVRLRTASGHWLVLHASRLAGAQNQIAVIFEVARPIEIAPLIVLAYNLTVREGEMMQSVLRGLSTKEISETYHITTNTVQDYFKAIFEKVGMRSRRELVAQIFAEQYQPHLITESELDPNGWFR